MAISDEAIIEELKRVADKVDGKLSAPEFNERANFSHTTAANRFGSWNEAKEQAGLNTVHQRPTEESKHGYISSLKENNSCKLCTESWSDCLVFHHKNPENKVAGISDMKNASYEKFSKEDVEVEVRKCVVLCSNCHFKVHSNEHPLTL